MLRNVWKKRRILDGQSGGRVIAQDKFNELSGDPPSLGKSGTLSTVEIGVIESGRVKQEPLRNTVLVLTVKVKNTSATALIDSGATHNFVSEQGVNKARIKTVSTGKVLEVTVTDGRPISAQETRTEELCCSMDGFRWTDSMTVIPMPNYDMVLGKPWLFDCACYPGIDFVTNSMQFGRSGKTVVCHQETKKDQHTSPAAAVSEAQFLNIQQARKELKRGAECIIAKVCRLEEVDDAFGGQQSPDISGDLADDKQANLRRLRSRYERCFPYELPPERQVSHEIKVEVEAKPPSRPPFRMSRPELDELQKQLNDLLSHGFIEPSNSPYGAPFLH